MQSLGKDRPFCRKPFSGMLFPAFAMVLLVSKARRRGLSTFRVVFLQFYGKACCS
jgi:hypothetical protein